MHAFKFGAIHWDAALPADTYFGGWATKALSAPEFRNRLPYFTVMKDGQPAFPPRSQQDYDRELQYAIDAGIDYFAYCRYAEEPLDDPQNDVERTAGWHELNRASHFHRTSSLRDRIGYCLILRPSKMNDRDFDALPAEFAQNCYVKIGNRPLVYMFGGDARDLLPGRKRLLEAVRRHGGAQPYLVILGCNPRNVDLTDVDAVSSYCIFSTACSTYKALAELALETNLALSGTGKPVIPTFTAGWNPLPRLKSPIPWTTYPEGVYSQAEPGELASALVRFTEVVTAYPDRFPTGHILIFAWNEFEEGGWLCPTLAPDGSADTARLKALRKVLRPDGSEAI